jgi:GxxExxY protein
MVRNALREEQLTHSIIGAFYAVYNALGHGFLEHVYVLALERELMARGHQVAREAKVRIMYKGEELCSQRLDMIVDRKVIVEIKSTLELPRVASRQLYSYLRATNLEIGLLFHFGRTADFYRLESRNTIHYASTAADDLEDVNVAWAEGAEWDEFLDAPIRSDD